MEEKIPEGYDCSLSWYWGGKYERFSEEYQFSVRSLNEIPDIIKHFIISTTRRLAGDKYNGKITRYQIGVGIIQVTPHQERFYLYPNEGTQLFLKNEWHNAGKMLEENNLFVDSNYNLTMSEDNKNVEVQYNECN